MARLVVGSRPFDMTAWDLSDIAAGTVTLDSATVVNVTGAGGHFTYRFAGSGFTTFDANGFPTDGTVTSFGQDIPGKTPLVITGLSISATSFMGFVNTNDAGGLENAIFAGNDSFVGRAGDDVLLGFGGNDHFNLTKGGNDTVQGGAGNDAILFGAAFTAADSVDGGAGADIVSLAGDYSAGVTFGAATMVNVETLDLIKGYNYDLTLNAASDTVGQTLTVSATGLGAANHADIDASALTGTMHLVGGAGDDIFSVGTWTAADTINGRGGHNTLVFDGDFSAGTTTKAADFAHLQTLAFAAGHNYKITTDAKFAVATIDASALGATDNLYFNGIATTTLPFTIIGGAGNDTIVGNSTVFRNGGFVYPVDGCTIDLSHGGNDTVFGSGAADTFNYGAAYTSADVVNGDDLNTPNGNDIVNLDGAYSAPITIGSNVTNIYQFNITAPSADVVVNGQITAVSGELFFLNITTPDITFDASAKTGSILALNTTATTGTIVGSSIIDYISVSGAATSLSVNGGGANDKIAVTVTAGQTSLAGLTLNGGTGGGGDDDLTIQGVGANITLLPAEFTNFTRLYVPDSKITSVDADVAAGQTITVFVESTDGTFDGSAETDGAFNFVYAIGTVIGGAGNDTFSGLDGNNLVSGHITGGLGADTITGGLVLNYNGVADSTSATYDTIAHFDFSGAAGQVFHGAGTPSAIDAAVTAGALSTASFDADLAAAVGAAQLGAGHAVLFTANSGTLSGQTFLIVDHNGIAGYQAGQDFVFHLTGDTSLNAINLAVFT